MRSIKHQAWKLWWYWIKWPLPLWRLRGRTTLSVAGHRINFVGIRPVHYLEWLAALRVGKWEPEVIAFLIRWAREDDVVFDVGTYVGGYTMLAARIVGPQGRVFAFEPHPDARAALAANLRANAITNVTIVPMAVSDEVGRAYFGGSADSTSRIGATGAPVDTVTLDEFCRSQGLAPAVIKMDIEGGETRALRPEACLATVLQARALVVEIHEHHGAQIGLMEHLATLAGKECGVIDQRRAENYNVALT